MADILDLLKRGEKPEGPENDLTVAEHDENFTRIESAANYLDQRVAAAQAITEYQAVSGFHSLPVAQDYHIELDAPVAGAITSLAHRVGSGSLVLSALINGIPVSGLSGLTAVASKQVDLPSGVNAYPTGSITTLRVSQVASGTIGLAYSMIRRPGAAAVEPRAFWTVGPRQNLPFWHGAHGDLGRITTLLAATSAGSNVDLDLVHHLESGGDYASVASLTIATWTNPALPHHTMLLNGKADALLWSSSPFCSGSGTPPALMPDTIAASAWISTARPPGYGGGESEPDRIILQRGVWELASAGRFDDVWRQKFLAFKRLYFIANGLTGVRIVLAIGRQLNAGLVWGSRDFLQGHNAAVIADGDGAAKIREALRRYVTVFKEVFGQVQSTIPGDVAYSADRLWVVWSPLAAASAWADADRADIRDACPENVDLLGVDLVDASPPSSSYDGFRTNLTALNANGSPRGLGAWMDWAAERGKPFALPNWQLKNEALPLPSTDGGDDAAFIRGTLQALLERQDQVAFAAYGNVDDPTASSSVPGSLVGSWTGIDNPITNPVPSGAVNQAAARAYRSFFRGREPHPVSYVTSGLASAGGVRRLNTRFDGPLLQVRRTSDQALSDIGFVRATGMLDVAALETFVGGSDGEIVRFYNQADVASTSFVGLAGNSLPLRIAIAGKVTRRNGVPFPEASAVGSPFTVYFHGIPTYAGQTLSGLATHQYAASISEGRIVSLVKGSGGDLAAYSSVALIQRQTTTGFLRVRRGSATFATSVGHAGNGNIWSAGARVTGSAVAIHCGESSGSSPTSGPFDVDRVIIGGSSSNNASIQNTGDRFGEWAVWLNDIGVDAIDAGIRSMRGYLDGF